MKRLSLLSGLLWLLPLFPTEAAPRTAGTSFSDWPFDFALIGDVPYDEAQRTNHFPNLIADLNRARLEFVIHNGDIKSGATPCTDPVFEDVLRQFQTFKHPLIYLFGDNEWSVRTLIKVGSDGRVPIGTQRLRIEKPPATKVVLCFHPCGHYSVLAAPPDAKQKPVLLFTNRPQ